MSKVLWGLIVLHTPPLCVITNTFIRTAGSCWFSMKGLTVALCLFKGIEAGKPC